MFEGRALLWGAPRCRLAWRGWPRDLQRVAARCQQGVSRDQSLLPSETSLLAFTTLQNCSPPTSPTFQDTYGSIKSTEQSLLSDCQQSEGANAVGDLPPGEHLIGKMLQSDEKQLLELSTSAADDGDVIHAGASSKFRATPGADTPSGISGAEPTQTAEGRPLQRQSRPPSPSQIPDWSHVPPRVRCWDTALQPSRKRSSMREQRTSSRDDLEDGMPPQNHATAVLTSPLGRNVGLCSVGARLESNAPTGTPRPERPRQSRYSISNNLGGHDAQRGHARQHFSQRQQTFAAAGNRIHEATHPRLRRTSSASDITHVRANRPANAVRARPYEVWYEETQRVLERASSVGRLPKPISSQETTSKEELP